MAVKADCFLTAVIPGFIGGVIRRRCTQKELNTREGPLSLYAMDGDQ